MNRSPLWTPIHLRNEAVPYENHVRVLETDDSPVLTAAETPVQGDSNFASSLGRRRRVGPGRVFCPFPLCPPGLCPFDRPKDKGVPDLFFFFLVSGEGDRH